jgi:hypothetical protein
MRRIKSKKQDLFLALVTGLLVSWQIVLVNGSALVSAETALFENTLSEDLDRETEPLQEPIIRLDTGKPVSRELLPGTTHLYSLDLTVGEFAEVVVEQRGVDVVLGMFVGAEGAAKQLTEVDSPSGANANEPLYWIADTQGLHVISVLPLDRRRRSRHPARAGARC